MKLIGLTGGIASGKSTATKILIQAGYTVIDCDRIAWDLAEPQGEIWQIYVDRYGRGILHADDSLDRQAVADIVFRDQAELKAIDALVHPLIKKQMLAEVRLAQNNGAKIVFLDVPLLFEAGFDTMTDENWLIYVPFSMQKERLMARNGYSESEALRRINSQMSLEEKKRLADVVIYNDGDIDMLRQQILEKMKNGQS